MAVEHHNPIHRRDYLSIQHLERYRFALEHLQPGLSVLDIACGAGYGSEMLRRHGCHVTGADYDHETISIARTLWPDCIFLQASALQLPFADEHFDAIITFETIEHIHDGCGFLLEMKRVLKNGGILICSTPNIHYTAHPKYHVKEYTPSEFFTLVTSVYPSTIKLGQYFREIDRIKDVAMRTARGLASKTAAPLYKSWLMRFLRNTWTKVDTTTVNDSVVSPFPVSNSIDTNLLLSDHPDSFYQVRPFTTEHLLRIMINVSYKHSTS